MSAATAFRFAAPLKFRPVTFTAAAPSFVILKAPVVIACHVAKACCVADSVAPRRPPRDAVSTQRPISSEVGCGDCENQRFAALYSSADVPKSVATAARLA